MRMLNNTLLILAFSTIFLTGCKKYLEQEPDNRTNLNSGEKLSQLLLTAYPDREYITFAESMSDNAGDRDRAALANIGDPRVNINAYRFADAASDDDSSPDTYWGSCYRAIAAANQVLEVCNAATAPESYNAYKGEALLARAYAHFMLVTFFSKVYDLATAAADPGIPYVTQPEKTLYAKYERKTVAYVYEMIEKDLTQGIPLLNDKSYKVPAYRFTKAAAHAFATRYYLFKRQYDKVAEHAGQVFPDNDFASNLRQINGSFSLLARDEKRAAYTRSTEKANLLLATAASVWARNWQYQFGLTSTVGRKIFFSGNPVDGQWAYPVVAFGGSADNWNIEKFEETFIRTSANIGNPYIFVPLLPAEEVLLNRAEAYIYLDNYNAAIADLNVFLSKRITDYNAAVHTLTLQKAINFYRTATDARQALINTVLDFRRAEFALEGLRWLDILRYKLPVIHTEKGIAEYKLLPDDPHKVLQIPQLAQAAGLPPNPR